MQDLEIRIAAGPLVAVEASVLAVPYYKGEDVAGLFPELPELARVLAIAGRQGLLAGKPCSLVSTLAPAGLRAERLLLVGAGEPGEVDRERVFRLAATLVRSLREDTVETLAIYLRGSLDHQVLARAAAEGAVFGLFDPGLHKTEPSKPAPARLLLAGLAGDEGSLTDAIERGRASGQAMNLARTLSMEPANFVNPETLAAEAHELAASGPIQVEVLDQQRLAELGMGGILAVGKGSLTPPRLIQLRREPERPSSVTLALVGKGVCFDSGGISLKPRDGMHLMKSDMAGGAAVMAAFAILARYAPPIRVLGLIPAVENMPSAAAQRPGDVFRSYTGKTVEVLNTDAEGRLVLADAVGYAVAQGATHVIDVATLTGTISRALGSRHIGAFASDDALFERLLAAGRVTGESFWRMPLDEEYGERLKQSLVADLNETGGSAGASVGAKFIQQFVGDTPWIHLDTAGVEWREEPAPWAPKGATGAAARTLAELALGWA